MATDSELLEVRPRLRNDAVFLRVETGVYLRHSETACVLKGGLAYQWLSALGPRMNGEASVAELCEGLDEGQRRTVLRLTGTLLAQGFVRDVPPAADAGLPEAVLRRFRPQINLIEHFVSDAAVRFARFRASRVLVAGAGPVLAAAVQGLVRNGLAEVDYVTPRDGTDVAGLVAPEAAALREAGVPVTVTAHAEEDVTWSAYDVVVFAAEGEGLAALHRVARALRDDAGAVRLLPVVATGGRVVLGPLTGTTTGPCWLCAALRLAVNGDPGMAADMWRELALGEAVDRSTAPSGTVAAMIGNAAALETFRLLSGQLSDLDERHVVVQDTVTLESVREPLLPHPACPLCRGLTPAGPRELSEDATDEEFFDRLASLVSPRVGVLSGWADESLEQLPLKIGRIRLSGTGERAGGPRTITAYHPETFLHARLAAARTALAWYAGTAPRRADVVSVPPPGVRVVPEAHLLTCTGLATGAAGRYVPAVSLVSGEPVLVPLAAAYPLSGVNRDGRFARVGAGRAAGRSRAEVAAEGLASALAHHGLLAAIRGSDPAYELPRELAGRDDETRFARDSLGHLGRDVRVYALPAARPAYAAVAVTHHEGDPVWAVGAALSPRGALRAALGDVLGAAQTLAAEGVAGDRGGMFPADFDPRTAWADGEPPADEAHGGWAALGDGPGLERTLLALRDAGMDAYLVDTTTADLRTAGVTTGMVLPAYRPDDPG